MTMAMRSALSRAASWRALRLVASLMLVGVVSVACDDDVTGPQTPEDVSFDPSLGVNLDAMTRLPSGVYIQTLTPGEGVEVQDGDVANLDYVLWLSSGAAIDGGQGIEFTIASGSVIDGFRLGVIGMRPGETRLIVIPSALGYGSSGVPGIPPNSVLVFRVTLNSIVPPA